MPIPEELSETSLILESIAPQLDTIKTATTKHLVEIKDQLDEMWAKECRIPSVQAILNILALLRTEAIALRQVTEVYPALVETAARYTAAIEHIDAITGKVSAGDLGAAEEIMREVRDRVVAKRKADILETMNRYACLGLGWTADWPKISC